MSLAFAYDDVILVKYSYGRLIPDAFLTLLLA